MTNDARPSLSVVLNTDRPIEALRRTLEHLKRQTIARELEVVIVCPPQTQRRWLSELTSAFDSVRLVETAGRVSVGTANAMGARTAAAEVVVFGEDHCFPEPEWAAALVAAHRGPWAAVGPEFENANPDTAVSWCDYWIGYAPWMAPQQSGEVELLPGHNSSYKKTVLLDCGEALPEYLQAETVLFYDLVAKGLKLYVESRARTAHVNFSLFKPWSRAQFLHGRMFGAERSKPWGLFRRAIYGGGGLLIPLVRLARISARYFSAPRPTGRYLRYLPCLLYGLYLDAFGQMTGYLFGAGRTAERLAGIERNRADNVTENDRRMLFPSETAAAAVSGGSD